VAAVSTITDVEPNKTSASDRWELLPYTQGMATETPELNGKKYPWGAQGAMHVKDGAIAKDLAEKYDGRVLAMKVQSPDIHDRGHTYFFGGWPEMPWKRGQDAGKENAQVDQDADEENAQANAERLRSHERKGYEQTAGIKDEQRESEETPEE
jgi:hypothetical protein